MFTSATTWDITVNVADDCRSIIRQSSLPFLVHACLFVVMKIYLLMFITQNVRWEYRMTKNRIAQMKSSRYPCTTVWIAVILSPSYTYHAAVITVSGCRAAPPSSWDLSDTAYLGLLLWIRKYSASSHTRTMHCPSGRGLQPRLFIFENELFDS